MERGGGGARANWAAQLEGLKHSPPLQRVSMGVSRKTIKNLAVSRKNERILTVSRKKNVNRKNSNRKILPRGVSAV